MAGVQAHLPPAKAPESLQRARKAILWVGHPQPSEVLPPPLHIPLPQPNRRWIWVAYEGREQRPAAALYAADFHGIVYLTALRAVEGLKPWIVTRLLREAARSCCRRGHTHFLVFLGTGTVAELKLLRLVRRLKDTTFSPAAGVFCSALIPAEKGWF